MAGGGDQITNALGRALGVATMVSALKNPGVLMQLLAKRQEAINDPTFRSGLGPFTAGMYGIGGGRADQPERQMAGGGIPQDVEVLGPSTAPGAVAPGRGGQWTPNLPPLPLKAQLEQKQLESYQTGLASPNPLQRASAKMQLKLPLNADEQTALTAYGRSQGGPGEKFTISQPGSGISQTFGGQRMALTEYGTQAEAQASLLPGQQAVPSGRGTWRVASPPAPQINGPAAFQGYLDQEAAGAGGGMPETPTPPAAPGQRPQPPPSTVTPPAAAPPAAVDPAALLPSRPIEPVGYPPPAPGAEGVGHRRIPEIPLPGMMAAPRGAAPPGALGLPGEHAPQLAPRPAPTAAAAPAGPATMLPKSRTETVGPKTFSVTTQYEPKGAGGGTGRNQMMRVLMSSNRIDPDNAQPGDFEYVSSQIARAEANEAAAKAEATHLAGGMDKGTIDALTGLIFYKKNMNDLLKDFPNREDYAQYIGAGGYRFNALKVAQMWRGDPEFARFATLVGVGELGKFTDGGKALTPTEERVVEKSIPLGTEPSVEDFEAKRRVAIERIDTLIQTRLWLSTTGRGAVTPANVNQLLEGLERQWDEQDAAGASSGAGPTGTTLPPGVLHMEEIP